MEDVNSSVSITHQVNITEDRLCIECEKRDPAGVEVWGESKLAKMAFSGSLDPCFVNNVYEIAEIIYSTAHARHEVFIWSRVVCSYVVLCYVCCYGYCASQKRIKVPMAPRVSFQPLNSHLAYPGSSEQCEQ